MSRRCLQTNGVPNHDGWALFDAAPHLRQYHFNHLRNAVRGRGPEDPLGPKRDFLFFTWAMNHFLRIVRVQTSALSSSLLIWQKLPHRDWHVLPVITPARAGQLIQSFSFCRQLLRETVSRRDPRCEGCVDSVARTTQDTRDRQCHGVSDVQFGKTLGLSCTGPTRCFRVQQIGVRRSTRAAQSVSIYDVIMNICAM